MEFGLFFFAILVVLSYFLPHEDDECAEEENHLFEE